jgi:branched-chain amino acid transport system ATP-binding protein
MTMSEWLLETRGLSKRFKGVVAVDRVDFRLRKGQLHAIIGPNGAGKTTFSTSSQEGFLHRGPYLFPGIGDHDFPSYEISKRGVARTFQITSIFPDLSVKDNIWIGALSRRHFVNPLVESSALRDLQEKTDEIIAALNLQDKQSMAAENLSHGDQRLLEIGIALSTDPQLLLLDEPTAGMSAEDSSRTAETVKKLSENITILIIEHDMDIVMGIADCITVFDQGRIIAEGPPLAIQENRAVQEVYLGA